MREDNKEEKGDSKEESNNTLAKLVVILLIILITHIGSMEYFEYKYLEQCPLQIEEVLNKCAKCHDRADDYKK